MRIPTIKAMKKNTYEKEIEKGEEMIAKKRPKWEAQEAQARKDIEESRAKILEAREKRKQEKLSKAINTRSYVQK